MPPRTTATLNVHIQCRQDHAVNIHLPGRQPVNGHPWPPTPTELQQVVLTQCLKYKAKRSSSVDTSPGSVDTRDSSQNTFWPSWDSVSTLAQVVSTLEAFPEHLLGCFGTLVSALDQVVSTPCSKHKTKTYKTGQVVLTQCFKYKAKSLGSVDTSPGSVDTRDNSQNTFWPSWDSVSTLAQVVSTLEAFPEHLLGYFGTVCRH
ncbi:hypothetical protein Taro_001069 [Colocasia esculenta]|uniref:Uncharacterized protein n=1 Tax=Colocasia esculenta TaxID=4460 RepID=A0A843TGR3_COLES|nr:hypothetical protein [Colocasia esculenta]